MPPFFHQPATGPTRSASISRAALRFAPADEIIARFGVKRPDAGSHGGDRGKECHGGKAIDYHVANEQSTALGRSAAWTASLD
jgi:hypothetical protein